MNSITSPADKEEFPPQINGMPLVCIISQNPPQLNELISQSISTSTVFCSIETKPQQKQHNNKQSSSNFTWKIPSSVGLRESHSGESRN